MTGGRDLRIQIARLKMSDRFSIRLMSMKGEAVFDTVIDQVD